jgi:hypothetical protein
LKKEAHWCYLLSWRPLKIASGSGPENLFFDKSTSTVLGQNW